MYFLWRTDLATNVHLKWSPMKSIAGLHMWNWSVPGWSQDVWGIFIRIWCNQIDWTFWKREGAYQQESPYMRDLVKLHQQSECFLMVTTVLAIHRETVPLQRREERQNTSKHSLVKLYLFFKTLQTDSYHSLVRKAVYFFEHSDLYISCSGTKCVQGWQNLWSTHKM